MLVLTQESNHEADLHAHPGDFEGPPIIRRLVSPTGFEPVLLAPEASALSRLSYGDTADPDYRDAGISAVSGSRPTLRIPLQA